MSLPYTTANRPYKPHGGAIELWRSREPEVLLSGPAGTGKSRACLEKLHLALTKYPGARALVVRKTRESLTESALVTYEEKVLPEGSRIAAGLQRRMRQAYHYPNGSELVVGGLDKPTKIMSTEYDMIYVQEATELELNDWESLTTRLRNGVMPYQQLVADTNPAYPTHWLLQRCQSGACRMLESRHEDNPRLVDPETGEWTQEGVQYISRLDALTGARKLRLRFGRWVQAEGVVYEEFDRAIHVIPAFPIPPEWTRYRGIDFGYTNPFVCLWAARDPDGRLYGYREIYRTRRTVKDHAKQITELSEGEVYAATFADHDAEDRATLHQEGIRTVPATKAITPGIQSVQNRLKPAGDGKPRLFLFENCLVERDEELAEAKKPLCTEQEFESYVWPKSADGKPVKEIPVDAYNHGMDVLRYLSMGADRPAMEWGFS